jgi:uncharacterized protein YndB with AHSA1/START domain
MNKNLKVSKSIEISASLEAVWDALTNPEKIKVYLFGTETVTDWKVGSPILFQGEYEGHTYKDKGNVLENKANELLKYNYWSGFSGLEDSPENYCIVTYKIDVVSDKSLVFNWIQEGFATEQAQGHTEKALPSMLEQIKIVAEKD